MVAVFDIAARQGYAVARSIVSGLLSQGHSHSDGRGAKGSTAVVSPASFSWSIRAPGHDGKPRAGGQT